MTHTDVFFLKRERRDMEFGIETHLDMGDRNAAKACMERVLELDEIIRQAENQLMWNAIGVKAA